ncbi:protein of unknown function [Rhodovastum atsumiense]|nr:protein of unknown function [Rhodovastum atsumiense]
MPVRQAVQPTAHHPSAIRQGAASGPTAGNVQETDTTEKTIYLVRASHAGERCRPRTPGGDDRGCACLGPGAAGGASGPGGAARASALAAGVRQSRHAREGSRMNVPSRPAALSAENVTKRFGPLAGVSLHVAAGEILGILGDNGAGKSTLVKILTGYQPPGSGRLFVYGEEVALRSVDHARALGIECVYQNLALVDGLSVAHNLFLNREIWGARIRADPRPDPAPARQRRAGDRDDHVQRRADARDRRPDHVGAARHCHLRAGRAGNLGGGTAERGAAGISGLAGGGVAGGVSPRTRPGGFASWTSTKGFALGSHSLPRSETGVQGPCGPCRVQGSALAFS